MDERKKAGSIGAAAALGVAVVLVAVIGLTVVYTGSYNIAATEEHASFTRWVFDTTFHNSIRRNAAELTAPADLAEAEIAIGAREYKSMCEHCHGGPGVEADVWASGMRPQPPRLTEEAAEWEVEEVFWLAKHGAKMTGMPAFGPSHDDRTLWSIAWFVKQLPAMTPERYAALGGSEGEHSHGGPTH
jgi:mono/diheme cytochrome c family protein